MHIRQRVGKLVESFLPEVVRIRQVLHQHPEMALQEHYTSGLMRQALESTGIELLPPFMDTDVVGILTGKGQGRRVALRADMDALPLQEKTGLRYRSERDGFMHACGHDGHTAALLGTALVLSRLRDEFSGSVRFVFQPGEEIVAAGRELVARGALGKPGPDVVMALHSWCGLPAGTIASRPGVLMAATEFFTIVVRGKGSHGSIPEQGVDSILTAARVVDALQAVVSRRVSALEAVVVSVCRISGGTNANILPDVVELEGTIRHLSPETGRAVHAAVEQIVKGVCDSMGASCTIEYTRSYIPTVNDADVVALGRRVAGAVLGGARWAEAERPSMGGEDFAYYITEFPGAMFWLGMGEDCPPLHSPEFDFNDDATENAMLFLVSTTLEALGTSVTGVRN